MSSAESAVATQTPLPTGTWKVDPIHSSVEFHVKHLGTATVKGVFKEFEGTLEVGPGGASASGTVQVPITATSSPLVAPTNLTGTAGRGSVTLKWTDNSTYQTGFYIERAPSGSSRHTALVARSGPASRPSLSSLDTVASSMSR